MLTTNMVIFCVHIHIDCERTRKGEVKVGLKARSWAEGPAASRQAKPNVCALSDGVAGAYCTVGLVLNGEQPHFFLMEDNSWKMTSTIF